MKRLLPPTYFIISITTMVFLHFQVPVLQFALYPCNLLGIFPLVIGIILNLVADSELKKAHTTVKPFEISTALITHSVFRISRHPMYLGMVLILFGIAIIMGSLTPFIVFSIFGVLMELVFVREEERMLEQKFVETWKEYKNQVRKWI